MDKKLKYQYNVVVICSKCDKPRYMGYTDKQDSELCTCSGQDKIPVYDKRQEVKELVPFENLFEYE